MLSLEQGFVYAVMIGGIVGLAVGLRKIFTMEQKILNIEKNMDKVVKNIANEEYEIEKAISEMKNDDKQRSEQEEPQIKMP